MQLDFTIIQDSVKTTAQGYLILKAQATRVGVQSYPELNQVMYRPADEVFKKSSMDSLKNIPLTVMHPPEGELNPNNTKTYQVGYTTDLVEKINDTGTDFLRVEMIVTDAITIKQVLEKSLTEVSAGYQAQREIKSGTFNDENYDTIQRNIIYNHIALLPPIFARAGRKAKIILDSNQEKTIFNDLCEKEVQKMGKINISGVDYEVSDQVEQAYKSKALNDSNAVATLDAKLLEKTKEADTLKGINDSLQAQIKAMPDVESKVKEKITLIDQAKKLVKDPSAIKVTDSDDEIMKTAVKENLPNIVLDSYNTDMLKGAFYSLKPVDQNEVKNGTFMDAIVDSAGNQKKLEDLFNDSEKNKDKSSSEDKLRANIKSLKIS